MSRSPRGFLVGLAIVLPGPASPVAAREPFEAMIDAIAALQPVPGLAVSVVRGDSMIYQKCFGFADPQQSRPITPETVFYPVDLSTTLLGQAAAVLHERKEIDLDRSIKELLPELDLPEAVTPDSISLRDLLSGSHGVVAPPGLQSRIQTGSTTRASLLELLSQCSAYKLARSRQRSPYVGSVLAALALERALARPAVDIVREVILVPSKMNSTAHDVTTIDPEARAHRHNAVMRELGWLRLPTFPLDPPCQDAIFASEPVATTLEDLTRWLEMTMNSGRIDGERVLPETALRATVKIHEPLRPARRKNRGRVGRGLGWTHFVNVGEVRASPSRGGNVSFLPQHRIGVVVLTNGETLGSGFERVEAVSELIMGIVFATLVGERDISGDFEASLQELRETVAAEQALVDSYRVASPPPRELSLPIDAYTGVYGNEAFGDLHCIAADGTLNVRIGCVDAAAQVIDGDRHTVVIPGIGYCEFRVGDEGWIDSLECSGRIFVRLDQ